MPQPRRTANGAFHGRLKAGHQDWRWVEQAAAVPMQLSVTQVRPAGWRQHPIQPGLHKNEAVTGPPADRTTGLGDSEHRASPDSELDAHAAESGARAAQQGGLQRVAGNGALVRRVSSLLGVAELAGRERRALM